MNPVSLEEFANSILTRCNYPTQHFCSCTYNLCFNKIWIRRSLVKISFKRLNGIIVKFEVKVTAKFDSRLSIFSCTSNFAISLFETTKILTDYNRRKITPTKLLRE